MKTKEKLVLISQGDPKGIGLQAIVDFQFIFAEFSPAQLENIIVVGDLDKYDEKKIQSHYTILESEKDIFKIRSKPGYLVLNRIEDKTKLSDSECGSSSYASFEFCLNFIKRNKEELTVTLVTLPVSKKNIIDAGIFFAGHTEVLGEFFNRHVYMCMYHPKLKVIPLTHHIPLNKVSQEILKVDFGKIASLVKNFQVLMNDNRPAVLTGLNPHAGEQGRIGTEDSILAKQLEEINSRYDEILIEGPIAADSVFTKRLMDSYSLVLACYHDQGLIPFKMQYADTGLNITLNLPILRVSPDHGPAFDAVKNKTADYTNIQSAIRFALEKGNENWVNQ